MANRIATVLAALALPLGLALPATAAQPEWDTRPLCADYADGSGTYNLASVDFNAQLSAPSCSDMTYVLYVWDGDGQGTGPQTLIGTQSKQGDGESLAVQFSVLVADDDPTVCVYGKTFNSRGRELDRAPDLEPTPCLNVSANPAFPREGTRWH